MSVQKRQLVAVLRILAPKLEKFSDRQIEVAQTWALQFNVPPSQLTSFIETYLSSTVHTRCWCVTLPSTSDQIQPVLARIGDHLQYFDGHQVKACKIFSKDRVHKRKPTAMVAQQLLLRFEKRWYADVLLTSFCKSAGERAKALSIEDLGSFNRRGFDWTASNNRYFNPRTRFYLKQIGSTLKHFCQCLDQELLFAIRSAQCPSPKLYNWLAQGDRKRRLQALKAQPVLLLGASLGNRRPVKKAHWITLFALLDKIPYQLLDQTQDWNRLLSGCPTDWSDPSWPQIADDLRDLNELFNNVDESDGPTAGEALQKLKSFIVTASYHQIASLVNGFHLALIDIREALDAVDPQTKTDSLTPWKPLLYSTGTTIVSPNGLQIIELKCPADLDAEHRALGHSIDGYDYSAYRGICRLISVRENGKSLASAEIQMDESAWGETLAKLTPKHLMTIQLRGLRNRAPKSGSRVDRAYQWFWAKIKSGEIAINLEWPDQTLSMSRYTNRNRKKLHAQACAEWINLRLGKT